MSVSHEVPHGTLSPVAIAPSTRLLAGLSAMILGLVLVWGAGFASAQTLHDTAHDVRHGFGFPCH
ncbi:cobalt transporter [Aureimonas sp. Leaf454]|uniref:CbtB domain-containing protein n=1 Tax=Aureimonas sp. Leaf454 TaxID=1736381 RepID=UPI0006FE0174|nr:CbtB domain-containing protein [Aureimonas sp. Leaf454]KQT46208.1 cobalt transporter [Aureimonas sp. Leaf454]